MGKIRRKFDIQYKIKVAEAIASGAIDIGELCGDHQLSRGVVDRWVAAYKEGSLGASANREKELERENEKLKAKIGDLTMQIDLLKKVESWKKSQRSVDTSIITPSNLAQFQKPAKPSDSQSQATTTGPKKKR